MRFLILEDDDAFAGVLKYYLKVHWPDVPIEEIAPQARSLRPEGINVRRYDTIFLSWPIGPEVGFEWLRALCAQELCPPIIVFARQSNEFIAVDALKAGAASFFPKRKLRYKRLIDTIRIELGYGMNNSTGLQFIQQSGIRRGHNYRYVETLHSGEFSSIYVAKDLADDTLVAFKVLRHVPDSGGDGLFDRFLQEYEMIAAIDHPNVVDIFDLGVADDHAYIAMEYLSEGSLATRLNAPLDPFVAVDYTRQIASALSVIHAAGILHRDLKPTNIMFRDRSSIALIDFGLAKQMELELALTGNGQIFGTPYYMSPEQGHGQALDARSDIYSLGCLFYEMLVGQRPFVAGSAMGIIYQHAHAERPMLNENLCAYSRVLGKMFAAEPNARYASAEQLLGDLDTLRV
ncbi:MAG TPA: protein kinase [Gammaproteobacteria bacterium]|nr:protein kinase [Gammaproteobacteria bacterium]